jgi:hypothetical protein
LRLASRLVFLGLFSLVLGVLLAACLGTIPGGGGAVNDNDPASRRLAWTCCLTFFLVAAYSVVRRIATRRSFRRNVERQARSLSAGWGSLRPGRKDRVSMSPDGVSWVVQFEDDPLSPGVSERHAYRFPWAAVRAVENAGRFAMVVFWDAQWPIPRRAFRDEAHFLGFIAEAEAFRRAAVGAPRGPIAVDQVHPYGVLLLGPPESGIVR